MQGIEDAGVDMRIEELPKGEVTIGFADRGRDSFMFMSDGVQCALIDVSFMDWAISRGLVLSIARA